MSTYRVADGHDVALGSLTDLDPQPRTTGIQVSRRSYAGDGTVYDEGKYVELEFPTILTASQYQLVLSQMGVQGSLTNEITIYLRDETFAWARMNGTAVRPEPGSDVSWLTAPRGIIVLVRDLENAS